MIKPDRSFDPVFLFNFHADMGKKLQVTGLDGVLSG
jgi:hypothetical protein